jgi:hypothetical protein
MADRWIARRIPALSQAENSAAGPGTWMPSTLAHEPIAVRRRNEPLRQSVRWVNQPGAVMQARSRDSQHLRECRAARLTSRATPVISCPPAMSRPAIAAPIGPVTPITRSRKPFLHTFAPRWQHCWQTLACEATARSAVLTLNARTGKVRRTAYDATVKQLGPRAQLACAPRDAIIMRSSELPLNGLSTRGLSLHQAGPPSALPVVNTNGTSREARVEATL